MFSFRDDAARRITVTVVGAMRFGDAVRAIERQRAHGAWEYGVLYNLVAVTTVEEAFDPAVLAERLEELNQTVPRGPVTVASTHPEVRAIARAYGARAEAMGIQLRAFDTVDEATRWLDAVQYGATS